MQKKMLKALPALLMACVGLPAMAELEPEPIPSVAFVQSVPVRPHLYLSIRAD